MKWNFWWGPSGWSQWRGFWWGSRSWGYCSQRRTSGWAAASSGGTEGRSLDVRQSGNRDQGVHAFGYSGHLCWLQDWGGEEDFDQGSNEVNCFFFLFIKNRLSISLNLLTLSFDGNSAGRLYLNGLGPTSLFLQYVWEWYFIRENVSLITLCSYRKRESLKPLEFLESPVAGMIGALLPYMAMLPLKVTDGVIKAFRRGQLSLSPRWLPLW